MGHNERHHRSRRHDPEDYDFMGGFGFTFRDPEEVFREFFGNSPFADIFGGKKNLTLIFIDIVKISFLPNDNRYNLNLRVFFCTVLS